MKDIKKHKEHAERLAVSRAAQAETAPEAPAELQDMLLEEDPADDAQPLVEPPMQQRCLQPVQVP